MKIKLFLFTALFFISAGLFAQAEADPAIVLENPWVSLATLIGVVVSLVQILRDKIHVTGLPLQITSWALGVIIAVVGYFTNAGMFENLTIWETLGQGLVASLAANGVGDTGILSGILEFIKGMFKSKKPA